MDSVYSSLAWLARPPADFTALCRAALDQPEGLGARLRALASCALDENQLIRLARLVSKARAAGHSLAPLTPYKLGVIANSTSACSAGSTSSSEG